APIPRQVQQQAVVRELHGLLSCHELLSKANELSFSANGMSFCVLNGRIPTAVGPRAGAVSAP
ncbi:MAG: hypothetical protein LJF30_08650, partial [Acidobacteria bacterium]|nr:hypothetical protein [Acidobacteriota bacterium]